MCKKLKAEAPFAVLQSRGNISTFDRPIKGKKLIDCAVAPTLTAVKPVTRASAMARAFSGSPSSCSSFRAAGLKQRTAAASISRSVSSARSPAQHSQNLLTAPPAP